MPIPTVKLNEPQVSTYLKDSNQIQNNTIQYTKPQLNEPDVINNFFTKIKFNNSTKNQYDILDFRNYLRTLLQNNETSDQIFYQKKIDYILSSIKENKYNFDIYLSGYLRTGSYLSTQQAGIPAAQTTGFSESGYGASINANKLLYDGQYKFNNNYTILGKRLANLQEVNAKNKLIIFALNIYANMYISQERLKIYKYTYSMQKKITKIIKESYREGKHSMIDYIDAQNDLLILQRSLISFNYEHLHNEYIIKYSIKSKSLKRYKLIKENINFHLNTLSDIQKQALHNSNELAIESNKLKISQTDLLSQKRNYFPTLNFSSSFGYGALNNNLLFREIQKYSTSPYFALNLSLNIPLYNKGDIIANKKNALNTVLLQKNILSLKSKAILLNVEKSFNAIQNIQEQKNILQEQLLLAKQKIDLTKEAYLAGSVQYRDYADAFKNYLTYNTQFIILEQRYNQELLLLAIMSGKREIYE